jgi:hypothetical protein
MDLGSFWHVIVRLLIATFGFSLQANVVEAPEPGHQENPGFDLPLTSPDVAPNLTEDGLGNVVYLCL